MELTPQVRKILSWYESDNPGTKTNLARMLMQGRLGGTGRMVILPVDQGFEHGPARSFAVNAPAYDPHYHFQLAVDAGLSAYAAPLGALEAGAGTFAGAIPTILKVNSSNSLAAAKDQAAVGATVNLASRIESYTLGGDVLVSAETLAAAGASVRVIDEMLVEPKGVREPITVHYVGGVEGGDALLLPRAAAPLAALAAPLDATVTVVRGKDATGGAVAARLVRASAFEGEFLCGAPIEPLSNVRLRFPSLEGGLSRADAYAKILRRPVERGFAVRFTSLPHDLRGALFARPAT